jgi:PAP2 superfamily protein
MSVAHLRGLASSPHRGLVEVATLSALYGLYEVIRGQGHATYAAAMAHTEWIVDFERNAHLFGERSIQHASHWLPGLPSVLGVAYIALHFFGTAAFLVWVYRRHPQRFPLVRNTLIGATAVALTIYILYPVAPPRLAGLGFMDDVSHSAKVNLSSDLLGSLYNPFAAVPSLHFGYALLVGGTIAAVARTTRMRVLGWSYPALMLFVIVATGNHFFFDAAAGAVAVGVGYLAATRLGSPATRGLRSRTVRAAAVATS